MTVAGLAVVPAAPLLLQAASHDQPGELAPAVAAARAAVAEALDALSDATSLVLLAVGAEATVHHARVATLASYGFAGVDAAIAPDEELLTAVKELADVAVEGTGRLDGDLAVLALHATALPRVPRLVPVSLPAEADEAILGALAAAIGAAAEAVEHRVAVVASGDLSAARDVTSPGYEAVGAVEWDARAGAAVRAGDVAALLRLGPGEASRVMARGWAPLVVLLHLARAAGRRLGTVHEFAPRGVGQLVAC